jgi:TolB-like protein/DNA-binding winged helix-turn-helix (wHTH) protein/lipoprotein NlpI
LRGLRATGENLTTLRLVEAMEPTSTVFRFGDYESRSRTRELYVRGSKLKIRPQPLRVLNLLLSRAGDVVTREELRRELWSSEVFVDFEHVLNTSIKEIRAVLNDSATEPRYIETLPKLGYRFIAPVEKIEPVADSLAPTSAPTVNVATPPENPADAKNLGADSLLSAPGNTSVADSYLTEDPDKISAGAMSAPASRPRHAIAAVVIAVLILGGAIAAYRSTHAHSKAHLANAAEPAMIAVLPFKNLTGDATQDYFSDGMTEEMIAQLGHENPQRLGVIARTSVMHYQNSTEPLVQIARELGVQYVLEGSVRRDADKVRITAQLIRVSDQTHILSREYDRELHSVLSVQGEIAQEISDEIRTALGDRAAGPGRPAAITGAAATDPKSFEAYDDYLKGRYFWNKRSPEGFQEAAKQFQQAIAKDPDYARAYAGLADTYALMAEYYMGPPDELIPKARAATLKALSLDEQSAEAHASLALIAQNYDWDWQTADKEFRRAIELDPNYATGHHWYAEHLAFQGRFAEAFSEMQRALQLDPLSLIMKTDRAVFLYYSRQYDLSIAQFHEVLEMDPEFQRAHMIVFPILQSGRSDEALAELEDWKKSRYGYWGSLLEAQVYGSTNRTGQAKQALEDLEQAAQTQRVDPLVLAEGHLAVKDYDRTLEYLNQAVAKHSPGLPSLKVDPIYDPLRSDPRFQVILRRIGLGQ